MPNTILSGMRPTGRLHIGHMAGALDNWVELQKTYEPFFFVADWHALTTENDTSLIRNRTIEMVKDWLAAGVDPVKSTLFIQSQVPEHAELHLIFTMLTKLPRLERLPTYKAHNQELLGILDTAVEPTQEQVDAVRSQISLGFLGYPVLQAADILLYKPYGVPVGEDQVPHIELMREIARTFNRLYAPVFPEPEVLLTETPRIMGTDGRKMSKSYKNAISPTDSLESITKGVARMHIDPKRQSRTDPGEPTLCTVYELHRAYTAPVRREELATACRSATIGCYECKKEAAEHIVQRYKGYGERRATWEGREDEIIDILHEGSRRARKIAGQTLHEVKSALKMTYC